MRTLLISLMAFASIQAVFAQTPDGTDINQAIPIYFGQTVNDIMDLKTRPVVVYSISLAKGQSFSAILKMNNGGGARACFSLGGAALKTISGVSCGTQNNLVNTDSLSYGGGLPSLSITYQVASPGVYYLILNASQSGINYQLQVTADGTPTVTPNPACAGTVTGQIDSITYSLQLIAASLPDEVSIGGTKLCATCTVKPPAYPQLVAKMEAAMSLNVGVSACYDAAGNIFQLKLTHP